MVELCEVLISQITSALGSALITNMLPLLSNALPVSPSMAYSLIQKGWKLAENLALEPVAFDLESNVPNPDGAQQLANIATKLQKVPNLYLHSARSAAYKSFDR